MQSLHPVTRFLVQQFYKNNEAQIWPKIKNRARTIEVAIEIIIKCKVYFY